MSGQSSAAQVTGQETTLGEETGPPIRRAATSRNQSCGVIAEGNGYIDERVLFTFTLLKDGFFFSVLTIIVCYVSVTAG